MYWHPITPCCCPLLAGTHIDPGITFLQMFMTYWITNTNSTTDIGWYRHQVSAAIPADTWRGYRWSPGYKCVWSSLHLRRPATEPRWRTCAVPTLAVKGGCWLASELNSAVPCRTTPTRRRSQTLTSSPSELVPSGSRRPSKWWAGGSRLTQRMLYIWTGSGLLQNWFWTASELVQPHPGPQRQGGAVSINSCYERKRAPECWMTDHK